MTMPPPQDPRGIYTDPDIYGDRPADDEDLASGGARRTFGMTVGAVIVAALIVFAVWYLVARDAGTGATVDIAPDPVEEGIDIDPAG